MMVSVAPFVEGGKRADVELIASRNPRPGEMATYERVLSDAMAGDTTLFARQDYVEEAWRIVDPILNQDTPLYRYAPHTWGPVKANQCALPARRLGYAACRGPGGLPGSEPGLVAYLIN